MATLQSGKGYFLLNGNPYPLNSLRVRWTENNTKVSFEAIQTGKQVLGTTLYSSITNNDLASPAAFASGSALMTWINANMYAAQRGANSVSAEFTRPANTTAYAAKDVICDSTSAPTVMTFTGAVNSLGAAGKITKALLITDKKDAAVTTRLHLYKVAPTGINDNAPNTVLYANRANYVGYIDFAALSSEDSTSSTMAMSQNTSVSLPFVADVADNNLYGVLEMTDGGGFTPASGEKFYVKLHVDY